ncbi:MAG: DUF1549 domain-containing protein [Pirellulaceae bacterium]
MHRKLFGNIVFFGTILLLAPDPWPAMAGDTPAKLPKSDQELAREVRSLLSNRCFACHGPDEEQRAGGFRFDDRDSFLGETDSGLKVIVPGDPESSEALTRIMSDDEAVRMPPAEHGARLTDAEIALVKAWIQTGANLPQHWSFVPPERPSLPSVDVDNIANNIANQPSQPTLDLQAWLQHPVDRFVIARQQALGMQPSPPATRAELLRRLSLDICGLPPTPADVAEFEADDSPMAYERQVDRLLASPMYGEHWARKWLDLARYADSAGYADDPARTIWGYRDWVIDALNQNKTVDQFTIEQLAGDLLPNPGQEQLVATAFHRNTLTNNEGGTNDEEFRNVAVVDRVNTTMAVWMGVTMACAQCHTHKYDPFTQEEYFKLFAIFNQSQDADRRDESPLIELFTDEQLHDKRQWEQRLQELETQLATPSAAALDELTQWEATLRQPTWSTLAPTSLTSKSKSDATFGEDHTITVMPLGNNIVTDTYTLTSSLRPPIRH